MKKFVKKLFKFLLKLFVGFCLLILLVIAASLAFPERISSKAVKHFAPDVLYSVGTIAWRKNGADFYDLKIVLPGVTSYFHRVSVTLNRKNYFRVNIKAVDGEVRYSPVKLSKKEAKKQINKPSYFDHHPIKFNVTFTNLSFNTIYGLKGKMNLFASGFLPKVLIENLNCAVELSNNNIFFTKQISAEDFSARLNLQLIYPLDFDYKPNDKILYFLKAFNGNFQTYSKKIKLKKTEINNFNLNAKLQSGKLLLNDTTMNLFDGRAELSAQIARKKVKGKNKWRFKYDVDLTVTNIDALEFCNAFDFRKNKLSGNFSGWISTMVFGRSVKKLDGKLWSDNPGILYFPEAEKYIAGMKESMQKQIFDIMVERLKVYPYDVSVIYLKYDLSKKMTEVDFQVEGIDIYKFKLFYNRSWIDAINLVKTLK